jgi:CheY-like chemotaxis protein
LHLLEGVEELVEQAVSMSWQNLPVLVVDDNETNRRILFEMLQHWGMRPTLADSGKAALVALNAVRNTQGAFPLILIDAHMPEMDGFALTERIVAMPEFQSSSIIMLTSAGQPNDARRCRELGLAGYVTKPIGQSELLDVISGGLRQKAGASARKAESASAVATAQQPLEVLLVEDNVVNQKLALLLLERRGHSVTLAGNGRDALKVLEKRTFDVCLMDIQMPELNGLETTAAIRAKEKGTSYRLPIIAMTAHAIKGDREICLQAGMDAYLSKPVRADEMFQTIEALLGDRSSGEAGAAVDISRSRAFDGSAFLSRMDGSHDVCVQIAETFFAEGPRLMASLREALRRRDAVELAKLAHALKGTIANFTEGAAFQSAVTIEQLAKEADLYRATEAFQRLEADLEALLESLRAFVFDIPKV